MDTGSAVEMAEEDASSTMNDDPDAMAKEDTDSMAGDEMVEGEEIMKEDLDATMAGEPDSMAKEDDAAMSGESDAMTDDDSMESMDAETSEAEAMPSEAGTSMDDEPMMDLPAWFSAELTDVNSGETLTVAGLKGKVALVETMAIWCSNCLRQQQEVKALHEALGMEDGLVTLVLDIDPNENAEHLRDYAARNGFDWTYAVAPREVAREIGQLYGDQFLNPPSTPMLIVDRDGKVHPLPFGRKSAQDLQEALAPFLSEGM
jgi:thiol-disulfide isomerase/thioredoxin